MPAQIHKADVGTVFEATIKDQDGAVVNVSASTARTFKFKKPDGTVALKVAVFVTDGSDGKIKYVTASALDLDQDGEWELQALLVFGASSWHTDRSPFRVYPNVS